jgi:site-specific DNA-methyltransferase (adenine-specific)
VAATHLGWGGFNLYTMGNELSKIESFRADLAKAETFEEISFIKSQADAVAEFAKRLKLSKEKQDEIGEFRIQVEAEQGKWLEEHFPKSVNSDYRGGTIDVPAQSMNDIGISKNQSSQSRLINKEPDLVKQAIEEIKKDNKQVVTPNAVQKIVRKKKKEIENNEKLVVEKELIDNYSDENIQLTIGDFYENAKLLDNESIDAIITDPPYPVEFMFLWEQMFEIAESKLKPSSFLVTYANHQNLDKIFQITHSLKYYWTFKLDFTKKPMVAGRNLIATWKPVIVYQKLPFKRINNTLEDVIKETKEFNYEDRLGHKLNWGQSLGKFEWIIKNFTNPNDTILEPFAGTGTTLVAAKNTGRKCIAYELDKDYEKMIYDRLKNGK